MADLKTKRTDASVDDFLKGIADDTRRQDCRTLLRIMKQTTGAEPEMWGPSIVGFGSCHYRYASGREGDWPLTGFAPRKQDLTLYLTVGFDRYRSILARLGKHKTGKACLYIKRLADVDMTALQELITAAVKHKKETRGQGA
ncbi:MAG TPA: DUF1801 domain-containing protein [Candidatus Polarisedimenticolia bacterium]|jgi:hypothetical protein